MEIVVTGRHTEVSERFRQQALEKLAKVSQLAPRAHRVDVELSHERNPRQAQTSEKVEITVRVRGPVVRAEACAEDPYAALDIALGKLLERLRRSRDRRKVHYGRQTPASVRRAPATGELPILTEAFLEGVDGAGFDAATMNGSAPVGMEDGDGFGGDASPVVIRTKDHTAAPMTLDQALYEMELVGHDFFLFLDAETGRPSVVYRRRGWNYGVIRLHVAAVEAAVQEAPVG
jgi:ribosomal subunit interface protein